MAISFFRREISGSKKVWIKENYKRWKRIVNTLYENAIYYQILWKVVLNYINNRWMKIKDKNDVQSLWYLVEFI